MQISNVNFICNSLCIFQCNLLCTPACKTNIQEPPGKGGVKVLRLRDQLGVSGESYPVLPDHPLPSSRTLLFSSKPPLSSAARGCPVLSSTALTKAASAVTHHQFANKGRAPTSTSNLPMEPDQQQQGALHLLHHDQQQQGDLGGKCSQAASNGHHFKAAAPET